MSQLLKDEASGEHGSFFYVKGDFLMNVFPVILSGGIGSRLWPLSRKTSPKQFISLLNDRNLLQNTYARFADRNLFNAPVIVCNEEHRFQVAESLREVGVDDAVIILEPCMKNTAPAIALAALAIQEADRDGVMLAVPSDHYMCNVAVFLSACKKALSAMNLNETLCAFGIQPERAETGYGYMELKDESAPGVFCVKQFVEKPDKVRAEQYLKSEAYYWNSGIFMFKAATYLSALKVCAPEIYQNCFESFRQKRKDLDFIRVKAQEFSKCQSISIDYAVMEKYDKVVAIPLKNAGWSDIGSWRALFDVGEKDKSGNILKGDVYQTGSQNCYLRSHDRLLAAVGVKNLVVVETADAIMVADQSRTQEIKAIVKQLEQNKRQELVKHKRRYSPWGHGDRIAEGSGFIVNKLYFKAQANSSLQMHYHRLEHFTVLRGAAKVMIDGQKYMLSEGDSVTAKPLQTHQIFAIGRLALEILEIQMGHYLADEDIVRL